MPPSCWRSTSWTAYSSAARHSIRVPGRSLCARPRPRYLAPRMYGILVGILILDSLILAVAVLLQAGQGGGPAPLGGGAGTETLTGGRHATPPPTENTGRAAGIFFFPPLGLTVLSPPPSPAP